MTATNVLLTLGAALAVTAAMRYDMKGGLNMLSRNARHLRKWMEAEGGQGGAAGEALAEAAKKAATKQRGPAESAGKQAGGRAL